MAIGSYINNMQMSGDTKLVTEEIQGTAPVPITEDTESIVTEEPYEGGLEVVEPVPGANIGGE